VQLVVLVALLAAQTGAAVLTAELLARRTCRDGSVVRPDALDNAERVGTRRRPRRAPSA
jgi:hypothetical protein